VFLVLAALAPLGGCSAFFVRAPIQVAEGRYDARGCTTNQLAPVADVMIGALQIVRTVLALQASDASYNGAALDRGADVAIGGLLAATFTGSAIYGFATTAECRKLRGNVPAPTQRPRPTKQELNYQRRADEAAEEAAVQARLRAKAAAAAAPTADGGATSDAGVRADGAAPAAAPNQQRDDGR
jgi:hypothetical protein